MSTSRKILIIGGGPAGAWAAISAKKQDPAADVALLTDEHHEPYEKPPLSKGVLMGKAKFDDALIAGPKGLAGHNVVLEKRAVCTAIDRKGKTVATKGGKAELQQIEVAYLPVRGEGWRRVGRRTGRCGSWPAEGQPACHRTAPT